MYACAYIDYAGLSDIRNDGRSDVDLVSLSRLQMALMLMYELKGLNDQYRYDLANLMFWVPYIV